MNDWVTNGYKNDYEQISAFIDQVMQRDMTLLKQEYRDDLEKARITGLASGSIFFIPRLFPGIFPRSGGWTEFTFSSGDFASHSSSNYSTRRWQAGVPAPRSLASLVAVAVAAVAAAALNTATNSTATVSS